MKDKTQAARQPDAAPSRQWSAEERVKAIGVVEFQIPGRVRLRLKKELRSRELMDALQQRLQKGETVRKVQVNHATGSVVIEFDKTLTVVEVVAPALEVGEVTERSAAERLKVVGTVEERAPGRIRLRLKPELRTPDMMQTIEQMIETDPQIEDVTVDQQMGIIVIQFARSEAAVELSKSALAEAELIATTLFDLPEGDAGGGYGKLDQQLADALYKVEKVVYKRTGLRFRGQIVAGAIAGLGILQIAVYGISLEMLPGPLLLWIAWDIYHRVNQEPPLDGDEAVSALPYQPATR